MEFLIALLKLLEQQLPYPVGYTHHEIRYVQREGKDYLVVAVYGGDITCRCVFLTEADFQSDPGVVVAEIIRQYKTVGLEMR
jgi:hypothetical protein